MSFKYVLNYFNGENKNKRIVEIIIAKQIEEALAGVTKQFGFVNEDGSINNWQWDIDLDKVKEDLQKDIDGATEAIEALLERKAALENKLLELNHPELIKN
jgi:GTP-dependent phosphoenolpyruvate carboxykinase